MTKKQNNNWIERFEKRFSKRLECMEILYQNHGGEPFVGQTIPDFIQSEIDKAVEDKILEFKAIIDRNTVNGMYSPDGIAQDLITFIDNEAN